MFLYPLVFSPVLLFVIVEIVVAIDILLLSMVTVDKGNNVLLSVWLVVLVSPVQCFTHWTREFTLIVMPLLFKFEIIFPASPFRILLLFFLCESTKKDATLLIFFWWKIIYSIKWIPIRGEFIVWFFLAYCRVNIGVLIQRTKISNFVIKKKSTFKAQTFMHVWWKNYTFVVIWLV